MHLSTQIKLLGRKGLETTLKKNLSLFQVLKGAQCLIQYILSMGLFGGLRGWGSLGFAHNCVFKRVLIKVMRRLKVCSSFFGISGFMNWHKMALLAVL